MYKVDKEYLMHDEDGYREINKAMSTNDDIDISGVGLNITPEVSNILDNYAEEGHKIVTSNLIYNAASNNSFNRNRTASYTVYVGKEFDDYYGLINGARIEPTIVGCNNAQIDIVYLKCIYTLLCNYDKEISMETDYIKTCLRALRKIFPKYTLDVSVNTFIIFDNFNIAYISSTDINTMFKNTYNAPSHGDFMLSKEIYPAYLLGTFDGITSETYSKIENLKTDIHKMFKTLGYEKVKVKASEILGVKNV